MVEAPVWESQPASPRPWVKIAQRAQGAMPLKKSTCAWLGRRSVAHPIMIELSDQPSARTRSRIPSIMGPRTFSLPGRPQTGTCCARSEPAASSTTIGACVFGRPFAAP